MTRKVIDKLGEAIYELQCELEVKEAARDDIEDIGASVFDVMRIKQNLEISQLDSWCKQLEMVREMIETSDLIEITEEPKKASDDEWVESVSKLYSEIGGFDVDTDDISDEYDESHELSEEPEQTEESAGALNVPGIEFKLFGTGYHAGNAEEFIKTVCEELILRKPYAMVRAALKYGDRFADSEASRKILQPVRLSNGFFAEAGVESESEEDMARELLTFCGFAADEIVVGGDG